MVEGPVFWNQIPNLTAVLYTAKKYDSMGTQDLSGLCWLFFLYSQLNLFQRMLLKIPNKYYPPFNATKFCVDFIIILYQGIFFGCHKEKVNAN